MSDRQSPTPPPARAWRSAAAARVLRATPLWLFLLCVAAPTLLASLYWGWLASDIYVSESRFVVRAPQRAQPEAPLGALLQGVGFGRAQDDAHVVHDFIGSRDALALVEQARRVRDHYADPGVDRLARFAGLDGDRSFEALHEYMRRRRLTIEHDAATSISTLRVSAFSAEQSRAINEQLLQASEALVNRINDRSRADAIRQAQAHVGDSERRALAASAALAAFRSRNAVFDPERQSSLQLQGIARMQDELISTRTQLAQVTQLSPGSPQIASLRARIQALEGEIARETRRVAGAKSSLADKSMEFERLTLERTLADRQFASALAALEQARLNAQAQSLYLERIVQPSLPDAPTQPRRLRSVLATLLIGLMAWGVLSILVAGVREHAE